MLLTWTIVVSACGSSQPPTPTPPGGNNPETITGRERLGWDQPAHSAAQVATFRYAIYVDNVRSELTEVTCTPTGTVSTFACSGRLPAMSTGAHVLELASFIISDGIVESPRSAQFRVTVTGSVAGASATISTGQVFTTADSVQLRADVLAEGLRDPTALAVADDGQAFVATADGIVSVKNRRASAALSSDAVTLAIGLSHDFARDRAVYVTQIGKDARGARVFQTSRFREADGALGERMVLLEHGPPSAEPAAALVVGTDGKLALAFDNGGSAAIAERMSEWRGKLLRLAPDGRASTDQRTASPILWRGLTSPRGLDWSPDGKAIWIADAGDRVERLRVLVAAPRQELWVEQSASYSVPAGFGVSGMAFYKHRAIPQFAGNLFVVGRDAGYVLRLRFDASGRPMTTEKLLEGAGVRAITVGGDGALYVVTRDAIVRLARV